MLPTPYHDFIDFVKCIDDQMAYEKAQKRLENNLLILRQQIQADALVFEQAQEKVRVIEKKIHGHELEMASLQKKNSDHEGKLARITNPREYASLQHEQEANNIKISQLEEQIMALWNDLAVVQAELSKTKTTSIDKRLQSEGQERELIKVLELGKEHIDEQARVCLIKREQVRADWLEKFDALKQQIANPVVELRKGVCGGCNNKVPAQIEARIERREMCACPLCGRILYSVSAL